MKKIILGIAIAVMAVSSQASYLWWQVDSDDFAGKLNNNGGEVTVANLYYGLTGTDYGEGELLDTVAVDFDAPVQVDLGDIGGAYSFYIELIGYDSKVYGEGTGVVGVGEWATYTALSNAGSITTSLNIPSIAPWHGTAYVAPEPTSAMLMMMGLALLSLKRRKE